jgi:hypothetical protein
MSEKYKTEEDIKKLLHIEDWRNLTKEKVLKLIQMSPDIDKEVYLKILDQVPNFIEETKVVIQAVKDAVEASKTLSLENKKYYINISNKIMELLGSENLSDELKKELIGLLKIMADYMDKADTRDKEFLVTQLDKLWDYGKGALMILAAVFGVKLIIKLLKGGSEQ